MTVDLCIWQDQYVTTYPFKTKGSLNNFIPLLLKHDAFMFVSIIRQSIKPRIHNIFMQNKAK